MKTLTETAMNVNSYEKSGCKLDTSSLQTYRRASGNTGFKEIGGSVVNQTFVHQIKFSSRLTVRGSEPPTS